MQAASSPPKFPLVWGQNAQGPFIRTVPAASQIGINAGFASLSDGFPPLTMTPIEAGGVPPFGQDMNGVLKQITQSVQWAQAGGPIIYDFDFVPIIGGYAQGAVLGSRLVVTALWMSLVDNNATDPDDPLTSANWTRVGLPPGTPVPLFAPTPGYLVADQTTVGNLASGAGYASDGNIFVFKAIWDRWSPTQCPMFTNSGTPATRGANAVADFIAGNRLQTPNFRGTGLIGNDSAGSTFLNGVPVIAGAPNQPASTIGENLHMLTLGEAPAGITSSVSTSVAVNVSVNVSVSGSSTRGDIGFVPLQQPAGSGTLPYTGPANYGTIGFSGNGSGAGSGTGTGTGSATSTNTGGAAHNNVPRSNTCLWGLVI